MSPTLVEALAHITILTYLPIPCRAICICTAQAAYSAHFCHCCSIYDESLVRGESGANLHSFTCCCMVFYTHTLPPVSLRLLAEQYVFASAQAAYFCFRSVGSSKQAITLGPRPVSTSHRQSVRSSLGIGLTQTLIE